MFISFRIPSEINFYFGVRNCPMLAENPQLWVKFVNIQPTTYNLLLCKQKLNPQTILR